jgi:REP element-mobilizing transposase RayT
VQRLADSLPQKLLRTWRAERDAWLRCNPPPHSPQQRREYYERFIERFQYWLDQGFGSCVLRYTGAKTILVNALGHFAGQRYRLDESVVMPNHVHAIVTPLPPHELSEILHSWKSFTAHEISRLLGIKGERRLWQKESFDHIVRSPVSLERIRQYIRDNPKQNPVEAASRRFENVEAASRRFETSVSAFRLIRNEGERTQSP